MSTTSSGTPSGLQVAAEPDIEHALSADPLGRQRRRQHLVGWAFVAPAAILFSLFVLVPIAITVGLSFTNLRLISPNPPDWVGLDNFVRAFTEDPTFVRSVRNTLVFALVIVPVQGGLGLLLALLINQKIRGVTAFRTIYFVPVVTSMVVVSMLWKFMYQQNGLINSMLGTITFGLIDPGPDWLNQTNTALPAIIILSVWAGVGFHMVVWLSGLQTIPESLYEAAELDGCGRWSKFRYVTWPGLRHTFVFVLVTITISAFALFTQPFVMTSGGPLDSTRTMILQVYETGFSKQQTGYGAALSLIFFALVLVISLIQRYLTRNED